MGKHDEAEDRMMTKLNIENILKHVLMMLIVVCALPVSANVGKVVYGYGENHAISSDGERRELIKGSEIKEGDTLVTGRGRIHVRLIDGGFISVYPNSKYKIDVFKFSGTKFDSATKEENSEKVLKQESTEDRGFFSLLKGAARQITGLLGRTYNKNFKVKTPVATIGIRGTGFFTRLCQADCYDDDGNLKPDGMYVKNNTGIITMTTDAGSVTLAQGQSAFAASSEDEPQQTVQPPIAYNVVTPDLALYDFDEKVVDIREANEVTPNGGGGNGTPVTTPVNVVVTTVEYVASEGTTFPSQINSITNIIQQNANEIAHFEDATDSGILIFDKGTAVLTESGADTTLGVMWNRWSSGYTLTEGGFDLTTAGTLSGKDIHIIGSNNISPNFAALVASGATVSYVNTGGTTPTIEGFAGSQTGTQTLNATINYGTAEVTTFDLAVNFSGTSMTATLDPQIPTPVFISASRADPFNGINLIDLVGACTGPGCGANGGGPVNGRATINLVGPNAEGIYGSYNLTNQDNAVSGTYLAQ